MAPSPPALPSLWQTSPEAFCKGKINIFRNCCAGLLLLLSLSLSPPLPQPPPIPFFLTMGNSYSPPLSHCSCIRLAVGFILPPRKKKAAPRDKVTIATALTRATPQSIRLSDVSRLAISTGGINLRVWEDIGSGQKKKSFHVDDLVEELLPHGKQTFLLFKRAENKQISILTTFKNFSLSSV